MFKLDVTFLRYSTMMSQSKILCLLNAPLTASNLSTLGNQNTYYKTVPLEYRIKTM